MKFYQHSRRGVKAVNIQPHSFSLGYARHPRPRDNLTQRRNTSLQLSPHPSVSCRLGGYILGKIWARQRAKEYFMRKSCPAWTGYPTQPNAARKHSLPSCLHHRENKTHQQNKQTNKHTNKTTKATKKGLVQTALKKHCTKATILHKLSF